MMFGALALWVALAAPAAPVDTGVFGVRLGGAPKAVQAAFAPQGQAATATWHQEQRGRVLELTWDCDAAARCFSVPSAASFWFVDQRLASVTLTVDPARAAPDQHPRGLLLAMEGQAKLGAPDARADAAGRRVRYHRFPQHTVVWVSDGLTTQVKLYLDALHPVGFAEAVAAGAPPQGLEKLAGGKAYGAGMVALGSRDFDMAVRAFGDAVAAKGASPLLVDEARLIQALSLAARAKARKASDPKGAAADLDQAEALVPALKPELDGLR
ncbi:MAG: hypothetical protein KC613_27020 [Myxococcales bacterium]|nr:hypothetical protein [Myxococcales bacterium]